MKMFRWCKLVWMLYQGQARWLSRAELAHHGAYEGMHQVHPGAVALCLPETGSWGRLAINSLARWPWEEEASADKPALIEQVSLWESLLAACSHAQRHSCALVRILRRNLVKQDFTHCHRTIRFSWSKGSHSKLLLVQLEGKHRQWSTYLCFFCCEANGSRGGFSLAK